MQRACFDENKALTSVLYIAKKLIEKSTEKKADLYKALKIIYFADRMHLSRYCRGISGDHYVAMNNGPVPSKTYDMLKYVRGDGFFLSTEQFMEKLRQQIEFSDHTTILPKVFPDLEYLSDSDIECLNESIQKYKNYSFSQLKHESHDEAFDASDQDDCMDFEEIAKAGGAKEESLNFVRNWLENENFFVKQ